MYWIFGIHTVWGVCTVDFHPPPVIYRKLQSCNLTFTHTMIPLHNFIYIINIIFKFYNSQMLHSTLLWTYRPECAYRSHLDLQFVKGNSADSLHQEILESPSIAQHTEEEGFDWKKDNKVILFALVNYVWGYMQLFCVLWLVPSWEPYQMSCIINPIYLFALI